MRQTRALWTLKPNGFGSKQFDLGYESPLWLGQEMCRYRHVIKNLFVGFCLVLQGKAKTRGDFLCGTTCIDLLFETSTQNDTTRWFCRSSRSGSESPGASGRPRKEKSCSWFGHRWSFTFKAVKVENWWKINKIDQHIKMLKLDSKGWSMNFAELQVKKQSYNKNCVKCDKAWGKVRHSKRFCESNKVTSDFLWSGRVSKP